MKTKNPEIIFIKKCEKSIEIVNRKKMIGDVDFGDDLFEEEEILSDRPGEFCRKSCVKCLRPTSVCLCAHIASPKINTKARVVVIQKGLPILYEVI